MLVTTSFPGRGKRKVFIKKQQKICLELAPQPPAALVFFPVCRVAEVPYGLRLRGISQLGPQALPGREAEGGCAWAPPLSGLTSL